MRPLPWSFGLTRAAPSSAWTDITAHRRRDLKTILPMTLVAAAGSVVWLDPRLSLGWLVAVGLFMALNQALRLWINRTVEPNDGQEWLYAGVTFVYTCVYGLLPLAMAVQGGRAAAVAGAAMLGAVALSSTAEFPISRRIGAASLLAVLLTAGLALSRPAGHESGGQTAVALVAAAAFLATMSHEIRTPLNGLLGMIQVMQAEEMSDAQRERLEIVRKSGEGLTAILNDVLDLSKIEAGRLELETVAFDLPELMAGCHDAFSVLAAQKGLAYTLSITAQAQGLYHGDPLRLRQVIGNLLSNAVKFTNTGAVDLSARVDGPWLEIAVSDTGLGVAPRDIDRLFGKFSQLDASSTRRHGGTGLGLAICRELCVLMGGEITVSSAVDFGSTFTVRLPAERLSPLPAAEARIVIAPEPTQRGALRVLAAEDNHVNQLVLQAILGQAEITPRLVANGAQAVDAWRDGVWDVVLMDVHMPVMDGVTATQEIRRLEAAEGRRRTPIIALTANAMSHQVSTLLAEGFDDHVAKPIDVATLLLALHRAVEPAAEPVA